MAFNFNTEEQTVEEFLNKVPYHAMKDELIKLGIDSVWKGGRKKADMIKEAVEKYDAIKKAIAETSEDAPVEVIEEKVVEIIDKKKEEERKEVLRKEYILSEPQRLMYTLLKNRHVKEGALDKASVIASKEKLVKKNGNPKIISYQIDAHDMILKNYE